MAKKKFKDVTGIKFADLIMPLVLGGVGSYSPAAGRGVGLGLQAFRTFQAGQAFGDERDEKKAYKEWAKQQADQAQQELEDLHKMDPSEVEYKGFEGARGPRTPVGGDEVEETPLGAGQISLFGDDAGDPAVLEEGKFGLDDGGELSNIMGGSGQEMLTQALLGRKKAQDAAARDLEIAQGNKTFSQALGFMDPNTGGYVSTQKVMADQKRKENFANNLAMSAEYAANNRQRQKLEAMNINLRADRKDQSMKLAAELDKMGIKHFQLSNDQILEFNPERRKEGMSPWFMRDFGPVDLADVPLEERVDLFFKGINKSIELRTQRANLGDDEHSQIDVDISKNRQIMAELWASLNNMEGLPQVHGFLEQFNAQQQAKGLQPLTMDQFLAQMGLKSGLEAQDPAADIMNKFKLGAQPEE